VVAGQQPRVKPGKISRGHFIFRDNRKRCCTHSPSPLHGIARVTSLKVLGVTLTDSLSVTAHVDDVVGSCARSMYAISVLRVPRYGDVSSAAGVPCMRSSSLSSLRPLRRGGALRPPPTDSVSILFCVELFGLTCQWTSSGKSDAHTFEDLCNSADDELFTKIRTSSNHILHALLPPPSTASQNYGLSVYTHFSYLNAQHISLTVIS